MSRGVNKQMVLMARNAIRARGEYPSIDAVRAELGNTGSKTTISKHLQEIEAEEQQQSANPPLTEEIAALLEPLSRRLHDQAQASVQAERDALARERERIEGELAAIQVKNDQLETRLELLIEQSAHAEQSARAEKGLREVAEQEVAKLRLLNATAETTIQEQQRLIASLEEKHRSAQQSLEHFRAASKEQVDRLTDTYDRERQQTQLELRHFQNTAHELQQQHTQLNRDNARLQAEVDRLGQAQRSADDELEKRDLEITSLNRKLGQKDIELSGAIRARDKALEDIRSAEARCEEHEAKVDDLRLQQAGDQARIQLLTDQCNQQTQALEARTQELLSAKATIERLKSSKAASGGNQKER